MWYVEGPCRYLDFTFCFFLIRIPVFDAKEVDDPSMRRRVRATLIRIIRQTSPFLLNLNLNPLYSNLGGSTIRADPLIKNPTVVALRWKPLLRWKVLSHRTFVLSEAKSQVCLDIIYILGFFFLNQTLVPAEVACCLR